MSGALACVGAPGQFSGACWARHSREGGNPVTLLRKDGQAFEAAGKNRLAS